MNPGPAAHCVRCGLVFTAVAQDAEALEAARSVYLRHLVDEHRLHPTEAATVVDEWVKDASGS